MNNITTIQNTSLYLGSILIGLGILEIIFVIPFFPIQWITLGIILIIVGIILLTYYTLSIQTSSQTGATGQTGSTGGTGSTGNSYPFMQLDLDLAHSVVNPKENPYLTFTKPPAYGTGNIYILQSQIIGFYLASGTYNIVFSVQCNVSSPQTVGTTYFDLYQNTTIVPAIAVMSIIRPINGYIYETCSYSVMVQVADTASYFIKVRGDSTSITIVNATFCVYKIN